jgi:hypothetical protein
LLGTVRRPLEGLAKASQNLVLVTSEYCGFLGNIPLKLTSILLRLVFMVYIVVMFLDIVDVLLLVSKRAAPVPVWERFSDPRQRGPSPRMPTDE